ncbi:hypothetical protein COJ89_17480 [Bacillus cereus]|nr:hypothetical protein COJ89_17480 [Bacillus cereus]
MKLYRRFFKYIDRNSNYIGDFQNISAQLQLYQRFSKYISDFRNISTYRQKTTTSVTPSSNTKKP